MSKVLIVDDALFMRRLIRTALEPLGYEIVGEAENGFEALEMFDELQPDLMTMDIVMPELDGLQALGKIREKSQDVKVVMITAIDQRASMLEAMHLGVSDFVVKPFDEDRIVSAVEKAMSNSYDQEAPAGNTLS